MLEMYFSRILLSHSRRIFTPNYISFQANSHKFYSTKMSKTALVVLAPGAEEMEFVITADVLRRCGVKVTVAGLDGTGVVKCSREVLIQPEVALSDVEKNTYDVVVIPGGLGGAKACAESKLVGEILQQQEKAGRLCAAICAGPTAFLSHQIGIGKSITSYPSVKDQLAGQYKYVDNQSVVQDGNIITSRGPGTAFDFGLKIAEVLVGADVAKDNAQKMLLAEM